jgi:predicted GNAT family acetyltransferase
MLLKCSSYLTPGFVRHCRTETIGAMRYKAERALYRFLFLGVIYVKFERYPDTDSFADEVLDILLEEEVQNNLPIGFIGNKTDAVKNWLLAAVKDEHGGVVLTAACTPPFNLILFETRNKPNDAAVRFLAGELNSIGFSIPGVIAEQGLARRFAAAYAEKPYHRHSSMNIMRLDAVTPLPMATGTCRPMREEDLFFTPYWGRAFGEECNVEFYDIPTTTQQLRRHIGKDTFYIWEDGHPVSQAVNGRNTVNGAVVNYVYTPPHYRNKGYAAACVATLSQLLLDRGNKFCALFADAENPISNGIYRKIGYRDVCIYDALRFD